MQALEKFLSKIKVDEISGCWNFQPKARLSGYGALRVGNKNKLAHRFSWELHNGKISNCLCVLHKCDNRECVNPEHLWLGTRTENAEDKVKKSRQTKGINIKQAKLNEQSILKIREDGRPQHVIGKQYGVHQSVISLIKNRRIWNHV